jgi:hypothetical protein
MALSNPHREALEALFAPAPAAPAQPEENFVVPDNLDSTIEADAQAAWDCVTFRWYRGADVNNVTRVFRFQRGLPLSAWHELLRSQHLTQVHGPFRTQLHAQR